MAGAGYKLFNTGDVLTAAQVNTYLQEQAVMRFANAAARTTALSGVLAEGMVSYLMDTDSVEVYNGTSWVGVASGDITSVTTAANSGLTGGATSGDVALRINTTAKGSIVAGTGASTLGELTVGANNTVLTADSSTSTGLKWAAASSGAMTYITGASFTTASSVSLPANTFSSTYDNYFMMWDISAASATTNVNIRMRASGTDTTTNYNYRYGITDTSGVQNYDGGVGTGSIVIAGTTTTSDRTCYPLYVFYPKATRVTRVIGTFWGSYGGNNGAAFGGGVQHDTTSFDSLTFYPSSGTISGNYKIYGLANS